MASEADILRSWRFFRHLYRCPWATMASMATMAISLMWPLWRHAEEGGAYMIWRGFEPGSMEEFRGGHYHDEFLGEPRRRMTFVWRILWGTPSWVDLFIFFEWEKVLKKPNSSRKFKTLIFHYWGGQVEIPAVSQTFWLPLFPQKHFKRSRYHFFLQSSRQIWWL